MQKVRPHRQRAVAVFLLCLLAFFPFTSHDEVSREEKPLYHSAINTTEIPKKQTIYILEKRTGMGSQLLNMLAHKMYFNDKGRNFMVDTSTCGYRWNDSIGLLTGYFLPTFPVIDDQSQYPGISAQYQITNYSDLRSRYSPIEDVKNRSAPIIVIPLRNYIRKEIKEKYGGASLSFYNRMALEACSELQFNNRALFEIAQIKNDYDLPNFCQGRTVAFHVRRGDKLLRESKLYRGSVYVDKLLSITSDPIDHCFIASADYGAVEEVTSALHSRHVNCTIHSITSKSARGAWNASRHSDHAETVRFLTETSMLIDATYFIGTFNSNVAALVALKRKCIDRDFFHYAHSYGVDQDDWYMRLG